MYEWYNVHGIILYTLSLPEGKFFNVREKKFFLFFFYREKKTKYLQNRPTNFASKSFRPEDIKASGKSIIKLLPKNENETDNCKDGELVTLDTICRFDRFLKAAGEQGNYILYDGLVSSYAPVSHKMHALEFLMDRASVVRNKVVKVRYTSRRSLSIYQSLTHPPIPTDTH